MTHRCLATVAVLLLTACSRLPGAVWRVMWVTLLCATAARAGEAAPQEASRPWSFLGGHAFVGARPSGNRPPWYWGGLGVALDVGAPVSPRFDVSVQARLATALIDTHLGVAVLGNLRPQERLSLGLGVGARVVHELALFDHPTRFVGGPTFEGTVALHFGGFRLSFEGGLVVAFAEPTFPENPTPSLAWWGGLSLGRTWR